MRTYIRKKLQVQEIEDVQSVCRLCLGKTEEMISIFDTKEDDIIIGLPMKIGMCLGLEMSRDDMFPKCICQLCNHELDKFYTFKKNCTATYRKLKASLFANKQTARNRGISNLENKTNTLESGKSNVTNENVTIDPSQSLEQNKLVVDILRSKSQKEENVILDENGMENSMGEPELKIEKEDCHKTPISEQPSELKVEGNITDNQLGEVNEIIDVVEIQHEENQDMFNHTETTQCLPEYIVTSLIDKGVLARRDDALDILDQSIKTFTLETPCGSEVVMELVEEEPYMPGNECNKSHPKIFEPSLKSDGRCCGACGARFGSRGALERHARVHSGERPFACRACGRRFAQREVLRRHQLLHADKLPYQCAQCPKAYTQRGALDAHARAHAPAAARPLVLHRCSRCPKLFLYPSGLSRHMSVHQGRAYPCDECARTFTDKSSLQRHRRAHQRRPR